MIEVSFKKDRDILDSTILDSRVRVTVICLWSRGTSVVASQRDAKVQTGGEQDSHQGSSVIVRYWHRPWHSWTLTRPGTRQSRPVTSPIELSFMDWFLHSSMSSSACFDSSITYSGKYQSPSEQRGLGHMFQGPITQIKPDLIQTYRPVVEASGIFNLRGDD
jgi:hypothetical protein